MSGRLEGKIALVTGGANGMGRGIVRQFVAEGASVIVGDIAEDAAAANASDGGRPLRLDVTDPASWANAMQHIVQEYGRLDVLVNNAGIITGKTIEDVDLDTWNRVLAVNLTGVMLGCKFAIETMKKQRSGSIINISSSTSFAGYPDVAYNAAKGALRTMTRSVAVQAGRKYGIRCNNIAPGIFETEMTRKTFESNPEARKRYAGLSLLDRVGEPDEIGSLAVYLASDEAAFVTGCDYSIDGGILAAHNGF